MSHNITKALPGLGVAPGVLPAAPPAHRRPVAARRRWPAARRRRPPGEAPAARRQGRARGQQGRGGEPPLRLGPRWSDGPGEQQDCDHYGGYRNEEEEQGHLRGLGHHLDPGVEH